MTIYWITHYYLIFKSPFNEQQVQRKRELEKKLEQDLAELNVLRESVARTDDLADKMVRDIM